MAGLCAAVTFDGGPVELELVERMMAAAPHRGADGTRTWTGPGAAVGFQRTVLLPEDGLDAQPVAVAGLVAVADARIDNRDELVPLLLRQGYLTDDTGVSDAEVVVAAYRLWGDSCAAQLLGDFAFVIVDLRRRRVTAARDSMGMRALYYCRQPGRLLIATEVKQLLAGGAPRRLHEAAIVTMLAGPHVPPAWTAYEGIEQLPPGHALVVDERGRRTRRYWAPNPDVHFSPADEPSADAAFRATFELAVAARLRTTRPAGIFLSGGMDSGSVASMAGWLAAAGRVDPAGPIRTYSWAFEQLPDADERDVSDRIVSGYESLVGTAVEADDGWPLAGYPDHGPDEDDPYCWVYQPLIERTLERCRADGVGLLLNGDRGDELTGDWIYDEAGMVRAGRAADALEDIRAATDLPGVSSLVSLRRQVLRPMIAPRWPWVADLLSPNRRNDAPWPPWIPPALARRLALDDILAEQTRPEPFDGAARTLRHDRIFLPQAARIAVLRERTRARYGMGFADPYSDRRLVELVLSMPQWLVQRRTQPKRMARAAMRGVMPEEARVGARKTIPYSLFDRGFRERAVPVVEDLLTDSHAAALGLLDEQGARAVYAEYRRDGDTRWDFWWPLTVEMWLRRWWTGEAA